MNDVMVDLETLSTQHNAAILSIGAIMFNPMTGKMADPFHYAIDMKLDPRRYEGYGHIDPQTVKWWLQQPKESQEHIVKNKNILALDKALVQFSCYLYENSTKDKLKVWSNGATFDLPIIKNALKRYGYTDLWEYWNERDVRTALEMGRKLANYDAKKQIERTGTAHNALDDAIHQVKQISAVFAKLNQLTVQPDPLGR